MNQLKITPLLIKNLGRLINAAQIGVNHVDKELKDMPQDSVRDTCENINEEAKLAIAVVDNFIYRATHNEYGEYIK